MGSVTRKPTAAGIINPGETQEFIAQGNTSAGQDGNKRTVMVSGKLQTQELISQVWTALEEI
ncbi:MAG: hypothetical protein ACE5H1_01935 [Thermodesulfobacteriota bacterium]